MSAGLEIQLIAILVAGACSILGVFLVLKSMAMVYAYLIIEGKREFKNLNPKIKPRVKAALEELGFPELATED